MKTLPEQLQLRTLELLLQDALNRVETKKPIQQRESEKEDDDGPDKKTPVTRGATSGLDVGTLPMRVKAFMKKHEITDKQFEKLFHIEGKQ